MGSMGSLCRAILCFLTVVSSFRYNSVFVEAFDKSEVDWVIQQSFECRTNPGLAVSVVKNGKVLFAKGYGVEDLDTQEPVTEHSVFGVASVSKSFAATLLVKLLYEKTKFTVDSKVSELLNEEFRMPDDVRTSETTFADLMAHRMGIPANNRIRFNNNLTRANLIDYIALLKAPDQFRVKYYYSNLMYGLVTRLAEVVGGQEWEQLVTDQLYAPLGMANSTFSTRVDSTRTGVAKAYEELKTGGFIPVQAEFSKKWALLAGSGAVMSSVSDMTRWMRFHLSGGDNVDGVQVMDKDHLKEVHKSRFYIGPTSSKDTQKPSFPVTSNEDIYAHGLRKGYYRGYKRMTHTGSTFGYRAIMALLPDEEIGVFVSMTGRDDEFYYRNSLSMYLMDMALGEQPWLNGSTLCSYPAPWKTPKKKSSPITLDASIKLKRAVSEYEGTYYNEPYGYLHVTYNQSLTSLVLTYGWSQFRLYSRPSTSSDKFYGDGMGLVSHFDASPFYFLGEATNWSRVVALKATCFETHAPPVFTKLMNATASPDVVPLVPVGR